MESGNPWFLAAHRECNVKKRCSTRVRVSMAHSELMRGLHMPWCGRFNPLACKAPVDAAPYTTSPSIELCQPKQAIDHSAIRTSALLYPTHKLPTGLQPPLITNTRTTNVRRETPDEVSVRSYASAMHTTQKPYVTPSCSTAALDAHCLHT